jgi:hypothetical protein
MERIKKVNNEVQEVKSAEEVAIVETRRPPYWQKIGGGTFQFGNRYIKPGEKFYAEEEQIPLAFRNSIIKIADGTLVKSKVKNTPEGLKTEEVENPIKVSEARYKLVERACEEGAIVEYDIIDGQGKIFNEKPLTKEVAEQLIQALS